MPFWKTELARENGQKINRRKRFWVKPYLSPNVVGTTPAHVMIIQPCAHTSYSHSTILYDRKVSVAVTDIVASSPYAKTLSPFENAEMASLMLPPAGGAPPGAAELPAGGGDAAPSFPAAFGAGGVGAPSLPSALTGVNDSSGRPPGRACPSVFSSLKV